MNQQQVQALMKSLSGHPKIADMYAGDGQCGSIGQVYIVTNENGDDSDDCTFGQDVLSALGYDWISNDCEGNYNEYMVE